MVVEPLTKEAKNDAVLAGLLTLATQTADVNGTCRIHRSHLETMVEAVRQSNLTITQQAKDIEAMARELVAWRVYRLSTLPAGVAFGEPPTLVQARAIIAARDATDLSPAARAAIAAAKENNIG